MKAMAMLGNIFLPQGGGRLRQALTACAVLLAFGTGYLSLIIGQRQNLLMTSAPVTDITWTFAQTAVEVTRFGQVLGLHVALGGAEPSQDLDLRYELLVSRIRMLGEGTEYGEFLATSAEGRMLLSDIERLVAQIEPLIGSRRRDDAERALRRIAEITPKAVTLAAAANDYASTRLGQTQVEMLHLHWVFSTINAALLLVGVIQLVVLTRQNNRLHRARDQLETQNARFDAAVSHIPQGVALLDSEGCLVIANRQLPAVLDIEAAELVPGRLFTSIPGVSLLTGRVGATDQRHDDESATSDIADEPGAIHTFADGRRIAVARRGMAEGGEVYTFEDITPRVEADRHRKELEAQLRQAQKMEAMGQLTGGVAHDFNNLLTIILGNAELLAEALPDPANQSLAKMIQDAAETASDLTQRLLAFGRRQSLELEPVKVDEVLEGMTGLLRRTIGAHIDLKTEFASAGSTLADKSLLESAILNLVVNAKDAMPQGGTLTIRTGGGLAGLKDGNLPEGEPVVFVTVEDTGTGMRRDVLDRVFEPFFTTKDVGKGSGLGLSMVYGFVQQSGGHVRIESQPGQGTSVTILLLSVPNIADKPEDKAQPLVTAQSEGRVLLVEDEPSVRRFVRSQLESLGYVVTDVGDGHSALDLVRAGSGFDLLLTDVVLPKGLSGVEVAREARILSPQIKVLLTSGYSEEAFQAHGRPDGSMPLLRKPFRRRDLAEAVQDALRSG